MSNPKCPHCGYTFSDDEIWHSDDFPQDDGLSEDFDCPSCENRLFITCEKTIDWVFTDEDGNDV